MINSTLAPIVLFVYGRPAHTRQTLEALSQNDLSQESVLYIFADGAKPTASAEQLEKIHQTRDVIREKQWCGQVHIIESETNKGLAQNIIEGVTRIVNEYGNVIVLEDDLVTSPYFLRYMNDALSLYENEEKVMHISGYMYEHQESLPETFFFNVPLCWGWATWKRAWQSFQIDAISLWNKLTLLDCWDDFNKFGDNDLENQLVLNIQGTIKTWFVKWHASVYLQNGLTLYPTQSLVTNIGFDDSGEHCNTIDGFSVNVLQRSVKVEKIALVENANALNEVQGFYKKLKPINIHQSLTPKVFVKKILNRIVNSSFFKTSVINAVQEYMPELKRDKQYHVSLGKNTQLAYPHDLYRVLVGDYTYIASNAAIKRTTIGKFCSIGPNLVCGWGIHPTNGISTAPMFYSTFKQNGMTLSNTNKVEETKPIQIGNDVFIGMNVSILDGVTIGDGAVIGAGTVVTKDVPPYAIAVGSPMQIKKYRFDEKTRERLLASKWWEWPEEKLKLIEERFFDVEKFLDVIENQPE